MGQGSGLFRGLTLLGTVSPRLDQRETRGVGRRARLSVISILVNKDDTWSLHFQWPPTDIDNKKIGSCLE